MMDMPDLGPTPGMGYDGMRGYGHRDRGFLDNLFGARRPRNDWVGGVPMDVDLDYDDRYPMPRDYGLRDRAPRGYGPRDYSPPRRPIRDFSPGRAWMANRARDFDDFDDFDDLDLMPSRRRDPLLDDLDLMVSRRDPLRDIPRRDPIDMMLERNDRPPPLRSEPALPPHGDFYRREVMSVNGAIERDNANKGWVQNKPTRGGYDLPRVRAEVVEQPKYKFNSPNHQGHVKNKFDAYEMEKVKNRQKHIREKLDEYEEEDRRRDRRHDHRRDRYDDDRRGGGRGRSRRRRNDGYSSEEYDDDDNPYHHLPAHIPKDDYDNAVRRNLHAWSQWRTGVNERGGRDPRMDSLRQRIEHQKDPDDHGFRLNDPGVLMNYAATSEHASPLNDEAYLKYGIPRVRGEGAEDVRRLYDDGQRGRRY